LLVAASDARKREADVAWAAAATNLIAALCLATILRPGLPGTGRDAIARETYLRTHVVLWRTGWLAWHAAALTLLALLVVLAFRARRTAPLVSVVALVCATAGIAADLSAEAMLMGVLPSVGRTAFAAVERASLLLTGYVGNGLYSLAGALLTAAIYRQLPRAVAILAAVVWGAGFFLSAATLVDAARLQVAATAVLMPAFVVFAALLARWLRDS
jgi:hypothetical protein